MESDDSSDIHPIINKSSEDIDKVIVEEDYIVQSMGAFGTWQAFVCVIALSTRFISIWNMLSIFFLTPATDFRCVKFNDNATVDANHSTCYENCVEYEFYQDVFDRTLISEFGLICDNAWLASFTQTVLMIGLLVGVSIFGWISDRFGRQKALLISSFMNLLFMIAAPFSPNYWTFNILRFFIGVASGGPLIVGVVYVLEIVGPQHREVAGCCALMPDGFAEVSLVAFAYFSPNWTVYLLSYSILSFHIIFFLLFLPESPRWLISKGKIDKAVEIMTKAANWNGLNTNNIKDIVSITTEVIKISGRECVKPTYLDFFSSKEMTLRIFSSIIIWTSCGLCYFGINQYITIIGTNLYVTVSLLGLTQIPMIPLAMVLSKLLRRKVMTIICLATTGTSMTCLIFIPQGHWACTIFGVIGIAATCLTFAILYVYVSELFPTPLRNMAYGLSSAGSKIGAMLAPFIANMSPHWVPSLFFAVIPFIASAFCVLLPETKGLKLKDSIN